MSVADPGFPRADVIPRGGRTTYYLPLKQHIVRLHKMFMKIMHMYLLYDGCNVNWITSTNTAFVFRMWICNFFCLKYYENTLFIKSITHSQMMLYLPHHYWNYKQWNGHIKLVSCWYGMEMTRLDTENDVSYFTLNNLINQISEEFFCGLLIF